MNRALIQASVQEIHHVIVHELAIAASITTVRRFLNFSLEYCLIGSFESRA